jgi:hypothetical protein
MLTEPPPLQSFLDGLMVALGQSPSLAALPYQCWTSGIIHYLILQHVCCTHTHTHTHVIQVGTATLDLSPLLRQGREFCEVLVELPIMLHDQQQQQAPQMQVCVCV